MRKMEAERFPRFAIEDLHKIGVLPGLLRRSFTWSTQQLPVTMEFIIRDVILVDKDEVKNPTGWIELDYIKKRYISHNKFEEEKGSASFTLITTSAHLGGRQFWFKCPGPKCRKKVRVIYFVDDSFGCIKCKNLTYESRNLSGDKKDIGKVPSRDTLDEMRNKIKKTTYRGKTTNRYKRYLELKAKQSKALDARITKMREDLDDAEKLIAKFSDK